MISTRRQREFSEILRILLEVKRIQGYEILSLLVALGSLLSVFEAFKADLFREKALELDNLIILSIILFVI